MVGQLFLTLIKKQRWWIKTSPYLANVLTEVRSSKFFGGHATTEPWWNPLSTGRFFWILPGIITPNLWYPASIQILWDRYPLISRCTTDSGLNVCLFGAQTYNTSPRTFFMAARFIQVQGWAHCLSGLQKRTKKKRYFLQTFRPNSTQISASQKRQQGAALTVGLAGSHRNT